MKRYTRFELMSDLVEGFIVPQRQARQIVNLLLQSIVNSLARGEEVHFEGVGRFKVVYWKARSRPPQMLATPQGVVKISGVARESVRVRFTPAQNLSDRVKAAYKNGQIQPVIRKRIQMEKLEKLDASRREKTIAKQIS